MLRIDLRLLRPRLRFGFAFALFFGFAFTLLFGFAFIWLDTAAALFFATFLSVFARLRMTFPVALAVFFPSFRPRGSGGRGDDFDHRRRHAVDELLLVVLRHRLQCPTCVWTAGKDSRRRKDDTRGCVFGAGDGTRTRDQELGKLLLYQLSYARVRRRRGFYRSSGGNGVRSRGR